MKRHRIEAADAGLGVDVFIIIFIICRPMKEGCRQQRWWRTVDAVAVAAMAAAMVATDRCAAVG